MLSFVGGTNSDDLKCEQRKVSLEKNEPGRGPGESMIVVMLSSGFYFCRNHMVGMNDFGREKDEREQDLCLR